MDLLSLFQAFKPYTLIGLGNEPETHGIGRHLRTVDGGRRLCPSTSMAQVDPGRSPLVVELVFSRWILGGVWGVQGLLCERISGPGPESQEKASQSALSEVCHRGASQQPSRGLRFQGPSAPLAHLTFWLSKASHKAFRAFHFTHQHQKVLQTSFSLSEPSAYTNEKVLLLTKMDLTEFRS